MNVFGKSDSQAKTKLEPCLEEIAFKWMFHCGNIKHLQEQCLRYVNEITENKMKEKRIYRLIFTIDVGALMDFNAKLGNLVCNSSEKAQEIFQEACFICTQTLNWIPQIVSKSQIVLQMRYVSVPNFVSCSSIFDLRRYLSENGSDIMPLISTTGIVSGMTPRSKYTQSTWYKCLNTTCHTDIENGFSQHYPNCSRSEHASEGSLCFQCGSLLQEDISCRILGEKCSLYVISPDGFTSNYLLDKTNHIYRCISVYVRDELIDEVELGACYSFSLIPFREFHGSQNSAQLDLVFEANNVIKIRQFPLTPPLSLSSQPEADASTSLPLFNTVKYKFRKIYDLYKDRETSPWSFTVGLSHFFGDYISPPGTYQRLKLGILLSLVSQQSPSKEEQPSTSQGNLNILVVSKDILPIQRLFLFSKSFTSRSAIFSPCNDLCYSISKDPLNIGSCMIHGGCLPLANNGVCVLTNLNELKSDQMEELKNVLQTECVSVEVPKKYIGCQQSLILMPVRCKIWACCETTKKEGIRTHHNAYQNLPDNGRLSKALVEYVVIIFYTTR